MEVADINGRQERGDYFRPIWARRWLIGLMAVIATVGTYVYYNRQPRTYAAASTLYVGAGSGLDSALNGVISSDPDRTLLDLSRLITSPPVTAAASKLVANPRDLGPVAAVPSTGSDFIAVSSQGGNPVAVAETVNAYSRAFIEFRTKTLEQQAAVALSQIESQIKGNRDAAQVAQLQAQAAQLKLQESQPSGGIQQIAPALPDATPLSPNPKKDAIFAFVLALMVGVALAYGLDRLDKRIRDEEELQPIYGVPVVGEIPYVSAPTPVQDGAPYANRDHWERFRTLRANLELATGAKPLRTILVASAQSGEGKSLVVRNLALAYADAGLRVAIVEADLRRPTLAGLLNVEQTPGLSDVLAHVELLPQAIQPVSGTALGAPGEDGEDGAVAVRTMPQAGTLDVVTSGAETHSLTAAVAAEGIKSVLARMTEEYDVVLIDSAPLLAVSDCVPLLSVVDGVVMVARLGTTTEHGAKRVTELLGRVEGARILGVVANGVSKRTLHHYGYGYEYSA